MWRDRPRGSGATTSSPHSSRDSCQGSVTSAGSGFVATMRSAMAFSVVAGVTGGSGPRLQEHRSGSAGRDLVVGVVQRTGLEAQAAAADAAVQLRPESLQPLDLRVDAGPPAAGQPGPVGSGGRAPLGEGRQSLGDLLEGEPHPLRGADESDPAQRRTRVAALVAAGALRSDQALVLVVAQRRRRDPRAGGELADRQRCNGHPASIVLDLKRTSGSRSGWCGLLLEGVLDLLAGLLEVGLALVALALSLEVLVVGGVAERLLRLAEHALALVGHLVVVTHVCLLFRFPVIYPFRGKECLEARAT